MSPSHAEAVKPASVPFSYAQAARGASNPASTQPSKASSGAATPAKEQTAASALKSEPNGTSWADVDDDDNRTSHSTASTAVENQTVLNVKTPVAHAPAQLNGAGSPASVDFGGSSTSTLARDDGASPVSELAESAWDTKSKATAEVKLDSGGSRGSTERASSKGRKKSSKKGDKKEKADTEEKAPKSPWNAPVKFVEAPAPTVNPWLARAQHAKPAAASVPKPAAVPVPAQAAANITKPSSTGAPKSTSTGSPPVPDAASTQSKDSTEAAKTLPQPEEGDTKANNTTPQTDRPAEKPGQTSKVATSAVDTKAWPKPETIKVEEHKSKPQEKAEGEAPVANGSKGKQAWNRMEFIPTVVFKTASPGAARRGGKGAGRGGYEGRTRTSASGASDRGGESKASAQAGEATRRERSEAARSTSPGRAKRPSNDEGPGRRQSRHESLARDSSAKQLEEAKTKPPRDSVEPTSNAQRTKPVRKEVAAAVNGEKRNSEESAPKDSAVATDSKSGTSEPNQTQPSTSGPVEDHKQEASTGAGERKNIVPPEFTSRNHERKGSGSHSTYSSRGRPERGRGGHRGGRNNGHTFHPNAHTFVNGQAGFNMQGYNATPKSPTAFGQDQFFGQAPDNARRYGRGFPGRASSIPEGSYGRVPNGYPVQPLQLNTNVQGNGYPAEYFLPATAMPYQNDPASDLLTAVTRQMEYYFSIDNLLKDTFLRKHMDSQGFVLLTFIANFKRLKMMTQDLELIKYVCQQSSTIEHRIGSDGIDRLRAAKGWEQWVLDKDARDPAARHNGPEAHHQPPHPHPQLPEHPHFTRHSSLPIPQSAGPVLGGQPYQSLNSFATPYNGYAPNADTDAPSVNQFQASPTNLSSGPGLAQSSVAPFGGSPPQLQLFTNTVEETEPDSFTDGEVEVLRVVLRDLPGETASLVDPASQPLLSNGSPEGTSGQRHPSFPTSTAAPDESEKTTSPTSSERISRFLASSSSRLTSPRNGSRSGDVPAESSNGVYYIKDRDSPSYDLPADLTSELYLAARDRAIHQRNFHPCPQDMMNMYQFWEHFLVRHFNARMYMEFRSFAMDDASGRSEFAGLNSLLRYYGKALAYADTPMRRSVAQDYVSLVRSEQPGSDRPAFKQLRAAWRDGALNMKNRKRVKDFLDEAMEKELDR